MSKIIAICGKICSGKTYYANRIKKREKAVILSTDEMTYDLINNEQGEFYDKFCKKVNMYLMKKSVELVNIGCNVILDWGFWTEIQRKELSKYYKSKNIELEWHYIDIDDIDWEKNIEERNARIEEGNGGSDFYVNDGLRQKLLRTFEIPNRNEIDIWHNFKMEKIKNYSKNIENDIRIIEYEEKYLESIKDLLVELEKYIIEIDKDELDTIHKDYREKMAILDLEDVMKNNGNVYLAIDNNKVVGVVMGIVRKWEEKDYLDYKCPKTGEITELIVLKTCRRKGVGKKLISIMERYFKSIGCEYITIDVFGYNQNAINFYNMNGYKTRMLKMIKKI